MNEESPENQSIDAGLSERVAVISPRTIAEFLVGRPEAILNLAAYPGLVALGAVFVLSAGFAREYDGEDLAYEPWHLLIPFAASLVTSCLLYCLIRLPSVRAVRHLATFFLEYSTFAGLYWMTAPLAWMYAIPFERWLSAGNATRANLLLLAIVSVWRVALITRVISVVYRTERLWPVLITVLFFGDAVMLAAIHWMPVPVLQFMGGVRLTESEAVMQSTKILLQVIGFPTLGLLAIAWLFAISPTPVFSDSSPARATTAGRLLWVFAIASVAGWFVMLPMTQPPLQLKRQVEQDMRGGRIAEGIRKMSKHSLDDFPPHWSPPPQVALQDQSPSVTDVLSVILEEREHTAAWVREIFLEKLRRKLPDVLNYRREPRDSVALPYLQVLSQLSPDDWVLQDDWRSDEVVMWVRGIAKDKDRELSDEMRALLDTIVESLEKPDSDSATDI